MKPNLFTSLLVVTLVWLVIFTLVVFMWCGAEYILERSVEMSKADLGVAGILAGQILIRAVDKGRKGS